MNRIRVLIADDHAVVRKGLAQFFAEEDGFAVVAECKDGEEALEQIEALRPDVAVVDLRMPRRDGLAVLRELKRRGDGDVKVILLAGNITDDEVVEAMRHGVRGVVMKEMAPHLLMQCVRKVHAGETWLEQDAMGRAMQRIFSREKGMRDAGTLTPREREIVGLASSGLNNRGIAEKLFISEGTVKTHLHSIYEKLNLTGRVQLVVYAREHDLA